MRRRAVFTLLLLLGFVLPQAAWAAAAAVESEAESGFDFDTESWADPQGPGELLLLSPRLRGEPLGSLISIYSIEGRYYLPLLTLARIFEIGLRPGAEKGSVRGFVIDENRTFELNTTRAELKLAGAVHNYEPSWVRALADDFYVEAELLQTWLPIGFEINRYTAIINFDPKEKTPLEQRLDRERRLQSMSLGGGDPGYPRIANEYRFFDGPYVDQYLSGGAFRTRGGSAQTGLGYATFFSADLLYLESTAYLMGNDSAGVSDYRITAGRHDYYGRLLGPLQAREIMGGDVYVPEQALVFHNRHVRGATLGNFPLNRPNEVQSHTFRGSLQPGWMVELYRDSYLVGYKRADASGEYVFESIPLYFGVNAFTLVFYGPYGERREERFVFNLADTMLAPGDLSYRVAGGQDELTHGLAAFDADVGVLKYATLGAGVSTVYAGNRQRQYARIGGRTFTGPFFWRAEMAQEFDAGRAYEISNQTSFERFNLLADYKLIEQAFSSESYSSYGEQLLDRWQLRAQTYRNEVPNVPLDLMASVDIARYRSGTALTSLGLRTATVISTLAAANQINTFWAAGANPPLPAGSFSLSRNVDPRGYVRLYGSYDYFLFPFTSKGFSAQSSFTLPLQIIGIAGFQREFKGVSTADVGLNRVFDWVGLSLAGRYSPNPQFVSVFLQSTVSVGYVSPKREIVIDGRPSGNEGAFVAKVFFDDNMNGAWDPGEKPVPNAQLVLNGLPTRVSTDGKGMALLTHLMPYSPSNISVLAGSLSDSAWVSVKPGVSVVPRPGRNLSVEFPIIATSDVDGSVTLERAGRVVDGAGFTVELVKLTGEVARQTVSAYDGYYFFGSVLPGSYLLRVSPDQAASLGYVPGSPVLVRVDNTGAALSEKGLAVRAAESSPAPAKD